MKRFIIMILGLAFFLPFTTNAFSSHEGCSGNCTDCHKLEQKEAETLLKTMAEKKMIPDSRVSGIKLAPAKGLWQIDVEANGKQGTIYLDFSKKYITGQLLAVDTINKMATPAPAPTSMDFSKIPVKNAMMFGPKNAKKKIAVFTDPDCPYCKKLHEEMKLVLAKRQDVAFYLFLFPLEMHKDAYKKVQAILCEKSQTLLDDAFTGKALPEPTCSNEQVEKNKALAKSLNINGTPLLVREDGNILNGFRPADQLMAWIDGK